MGGNFSFRAHWNPTQLSLQGFPYSGPRPSWEPVHSELTPVLSAQTHKDRPHLAVPRAQQPFGFRGGRFELIVQPPSLQDPIVFLFKRRVDIKPV